MPSPWGVGFNIGVLGRHIQAIALTNAVAKKAASEPMWGAHFRAPGNIGGKVVGGDRILW